MSHQKLRAIIKVGKSSDIKFNNVQAYRAINYREVEGMLSEDESISFVVFEEVKETDISRIKNILKSFNILGIIYNKQNIDSNIIDELGIQAVKSLKDLQLYIESQLGVDVATFKSEEIQDDYGITESTDWNIGDTEELDSQDDIESISIEEESTAGSTDMIGGLEDAIEALNTNFEADSRKQEEQIQNADIMSKDDIEGEDDDFEAIFDSLDKDHSEPIETLEQIEDRKKYEEEIEAVNKQLNYALDSIRNLSELKVHLEDELKQYKDFIECIKTSEEVVEVTVNSVGKKELEEKVNTLQTKVDQLRLELEEANKLTDVIAELEKVALDRDNEIKNLKVELENAASNETVLALNKRLNLEVNSRLFVTQGLTAINNELMNTQNALAKKMQEVGQLLTEYRKLELTIQELTAEKEELAKSKQETEITLGNQITSLSEKLGSLTIELAEANQKLLEQAQEFAQKEQRLISLTEELNSTKELLEATQKILNEQSNTVHRFEAMGVEEMQENMLALEESNSTLAEEIGRLRRDADELNRQLKAKDMDLNRMSEEKRSLTISLKAAAKKIGAGESMRINCNYSGRAFILPVFGSGSFGISSTAVSLAYALKGNVLIMDFDIVNPKLDTWYGRNPLNKNLPDISNDMKKTAFGALVEKGTDYVIKHRLDIITTVAETRNGENRVDYFSGIYTRIDLFKLMAVDFSELLTYFGNEYDYIVVDLGRIGGSEITNALIRMFDEISFKNILVALHDGADCRTLSLRAQTERITRNKSIWVLNLAKSDRMDNLMKHSLSTSNYVIFGRDMKIYGERVPYNKVGILKDRLKKLVDLILQ